MAKKRKSGGGKSRRAKLQDVVPVTPDAVLKRLLAHAKRTKKEISEIAGEFGQAVANAVEHQHLHRKAFGHVKQIDAMTDEKLAEYLLHRDHYEEAAGIRARADKVQRLPLEVSEATEEPKTGDGKIVTIGEAARRAVERAAEQQQTAAE